eukprot:10546573-Alexandrium_andersonii.AAC.1
MTDQHLEALRSRLEDMVFESFQTVGDPMFEQGLVALLKPATGGEQPKEANNNAGEGNEPNGNEGGGGSSSAGGDNGRAAGRGKAGAPANPGNREKLMATLANLEAGGATSG